jgi:hypothetical protein
MTVASVASLKKVLKRSFEREEEAASIYESDELIDAAKIPESTKPAIRGGKKSALRYRNIFSDALDEVRRAGKYARPTRPMATAAKSVIKHHITAISLASRIFGAFSIAINRINTCGIPK